MSDLFPDNRPETIRADLAHGRSRRRWGHWRFWVAGFTALLLLSILGAAFGWKMYFADLPKIPPPQVLWSLGRSPGMAFYDRNGQLIATRGSRHGERVTLEELPSYVPFAFLAAEDRRFYQHGPVDLIGIARAMRANVSAGGIVQGGSTLTQQLAKTIFLTSDQTFTRKVREAVMANRLERALGKKGVLELYLNRVYFGSNAYGIEAASRIYFGKSARQLTLSEAALLAALPKAPSRLAPTKDMEGALARQKTILSRMIEEEWITPQDLSSAIADPPRLAPPSPGEGDYGYALDLASVEVQKLAGQDSPDLLVQLTIDPKLQAAANSVVRQVIASDGKRAGADQAALVALGPDGAVRALVGGLDHDYSAFDRAVQARRQPGSSFKPFIYAAALETGVRPTDIEQDAPVRLGPWSPQNYGGGYSGQVSVQDALARSINTVAVRLAQQAGSKRIGELAHRFGLAGIPDRPEMSVALGAYEVSLMELVSGYQVFQQSGRRSPPYLVQSISSSGGRRLYDHTSSGALQVYDSELSRMMVGMMQGVIDHGTGRRAAFGRPAAGKTGTTSNYRDAWFAGFTPDWVAGVWVGNDDNRPMNQVTGGDLPADIWRRFMIIAHQGVQVHGFGPAAMVGAPTQPGGSDAPAPADARAAFYGELEKAFSEAAAHPPPEPPTQ